MPQPAIPRPRSLPIRIALVAIAALALLGASSALGTQTKRVAKEAENATLNETILVTMKGKTLYSLSAETKGRFICTGSCLALWKPLVVPAGVKPMGPVTLGTRKRPDGRTQVTYKGLPLYSFNGDSKPGEANGQGMKDVGTWHAAKVKKSSSGSQPESEAPPYPY
ncbi:MAG: COG4315 family predicted lipoprotein [Solirubrobacterales bacterium]